MPNTAPEVRDAGDYLHVVAAVVEREGRVLIARRSPDRHQGGLWEFPGGKVEPGETARVALGRELYEEVGIAVRSARPLIQVYHRYPDKDVFLDVWRVDEFTGEPHGREGQPVRWVAPHQLSGFEFPAANRPIVSAARLPDCYLITPDPGSRRQWPRFLEQLVRRLREGGIGLVQFRAYGLSDADYQELATQVIAAAHDQGAGVVLNSDPGLVPTLGADGVHLNSMRLGRVTSRPLSSEFWVGASCHGRSELEHAAEIGCDFALLSPVQVTASHPEAELLGWNSFRDLVRVTAMPVYALGGVSVADLSMAWAHGAQGIAAIRGLWEGS